MFVNILQFSFSLSYTGPKIFLYTLSFQKCFVFCLSLLVSRFLMHMLKVCLLGMRGLDWVNLGEDKDRWWALVNAVMNLWVP